ncbi:MAG TPA: M48 family metalloprotease, partial [Pyrinomonadaceae bacterium]
RTWLTKENEKRYLNNLFIGQEQRWRNSLRHRLLSGFKNKPSRRSLVTGWKARWRDRLMACLKQSKARERKRVKRFEQLKERRHRRILVRTMQDTAVIRDTIVTTGAIVLSLVSVSVIFDVIRYFIAYEIPTDAYLIWSKLYLPERIGINGLLVVVMILLTAFLSVTRWVNTYWKRALVAIFCGGLTACYIHSNFQIPKNDKYANNVVASFVDAPEVSFEIKAKVIALVAQYGISERQLFIVRGEKGNVLNAYTSGKAAAAKIFFTERLLREMRPEAVAFAAAHELGHANDFTYKPAQNQIILLAHTAICLLMTCIIWAGLQFALPRSWKTPCALTTGMLACLLLLYIYMLILPALNNRLSWDAESYADLFAARLTITDEASRQAALEVFNQLSAASRFGYKSPYIIQLMLNDHPSYAERQQQVRDFRRMSISGK